jgi:hypothetical protein
MNPKRKPPFFVNSVLCTIPWTPTGSWLVPASGSPRPHSSFFSPFFWLLLFDLLVSESQALRAALAWVAALVAKATASANCVCKDVSSDLITALS